MIDYDSRRWRSHLFIVAGSVAPAVLLRVALFVAWSVVVVLIHRFVYRVEVAATVHTLLGVALGLLLVFRTNASYERFWEGRTLWGSIVNESRNLARSACAYMPRDSIRVKTIVWWTIAFAYGSMHSLRGKRDLGPVSERLPSEDVSRVLAGAHVPLSVATAISSNLVAAARRGELSDYWTVAIDSNVQQLVNYIGSCERIQRTPMPFAYAVHLRRALVLYCLTLPFVLVGQFGWSTVLYTFLFTYVFCGIDEIGVEIENPFGTDPNDLPLEHLCAGIERELLGLLDERQAAAVEPA